MRKSPGILSRQQSRSINKPSNLLVLRGVYLGNETPAEIKEPTEYKTTYPKLPTKFTCVENWPKCTSLKCHICDQNFSTYPAFFPTNPTIEKGADVCDPVGCFCDWHCASKYIEQEIAPEHRWEAMRLLCLFEYKFSGERKIRIWPSISKILMSQYCGDGLTLKQWRELRASMAKKYVCNEPKIT